jgi:phosphohistidine phosphatase
MDPVSTEEASIVKLYFVRHATAARKTTWRKDDDLRPLTRTGRACFRTAADQLFSAGVLTPQRIVTSPLTRATQTAAILNKSLGGKVPVVEDWRLGLLFDTADLSAILAENRDVKSLAIVGHNPSFWEVLAEVIGSGDIDMRKGAIALVDVADVAAPKGRLLWLAPPSLFGPLP